MQIYELHTNEGKFLVSQKPTGEEMFAYIRHKREQGMALKDIVFCWTTKHVASSAKYAVGLNQFKQKKEELKNEKA